MAVERGQPGNLVIIANSARWLVQSAARAGYRCYAIDLYGDQDTLDVCHGWSALDKTGERGISRRIAGWQLDPLDTVVIPGAGLEDRPDLLELIAAKYRVAGNACRAFRHVNSPRNFFATLDRLQICHPEISWQRPGDCTGWLAKLAGNCGGLGVRDAVTHAGVADYYQRKVSGIDLSCLFIANGVDYRIVGCQRQRSVRLSDSLPSVFGGVETVVWDGESWSRRLQDYLRILVREFGLRGINSLDMVLDEYRQIQVLEINARPSASGMLYDMAFDNGIIDAHVKAVAGSLPDVRQDAGNRSRGYRICYVDRDSRVARGLVWPEWVSDRPQPGALLPAGSPACSVSAIADTECDLEHLLADRCRWVQCHVLGGSKQV